MLILSNWTNHRFKGKVPCTSLDKAADSVQACPTFHAATAEPMAPTIVQYGARVGQVWMAWVDVDLGPNETIAVDLARGQDALATPLEHWTTKFLDLLDVPTINQVPLQIVPVNGGLIETDGPAMRVLFRAKVSRLVWADLWVSHVPGEPWARFELELNAADPSVDATRESFPQGFELRVGNALVGYLGGRFGTLLKGDWMAHGQARQFAGVIFWPNEATEQDNESAAALIQGAPFGVDQRLENVIAGLGVPGRAARWSATKFVYSKFSECIASIYTWPSPGVGIAMRSGQTGEVEDQCFSARGTECFGGLPVNVMAAVATYAIALGYAKRPCSWREHNGDLLTPERHPDLRMWSGQVHGNHSVSPDRLGQSQMPNVVDTHGWEGPDREHWFMGRLFTAAMLTGSKALQRQLEQQARLVLLQETVDPRLATSHAGASRAVGWFCIMAVALWNTLENRTTAQKVRFRAEKRMSEVYARELKTNKVPAWTDVRRDDRVSKDLEKHYANIVMPDHTVIPAANELPAGAVSYQTLYRWPRAVMVYQQALQAFGLQVLFEAFGDHDAGMLALQSAEAVVQFGYTGDTQQGWTEWSVLGVPEGDGPLPAEQYAQGKGASRGSFRLAWMPLAAWVVLRHRHDERAQSIWDMLRAEASTGADVLAWMPDLTRGVSITSA